MLVAILFGVTGCRNYKNQEEKSKKENLIVNEKNIQADAILYVEGSGGEIIEKNIYYFDFSNKKLFKQEDSTIIPLQSEEEAKNDNINHKIDFVKEYNLNQEQIDKIKELIKQANDKNEQQDQQLATNAKLKIDGKEYAVNDYYFTWRELLLSITR